MAVPVITISGVVEGAGMRNLTVKDLRAVLGLVRLLNDDSGGIEVPDHVLDRLITVVGCDSMTYNRVEPGCGRHLSAVMWPREVDPRILPGFDEVVGQHPGFAAYRAGRIDLGVPATLGDLLPVPALRRLRLHVDYHRPFAIEDQIMCLAHRDRGQCRVVAFNRSRRGFSGRDHAVVELVTAHLYRRWPVGSGWRRYGRRCDS